MSISNKVQVVILSGGQIPILNVPGPILKPVLIDTYTYEKLKRMGLRVILKKDTEKKNKEIQPVAVKEEKNTAKEEIPEVKVDELMEEVVEENKSAAEVLTEEIQKEVNQHEEVAVLTTEYSEEELKSMTKNELRRLLRDSYNISTNKNTPVEELINKVLEARKNS